MPRIAGRDRKVELLEAARDLIFTEGASRFTIRRLAERVQVSEAAAYRHYASKEALLLALLDWLFRDWANGIRIVLLSTCEASQRLRQLADFHLDYLLNSQFNPILLLSDATDPSQKALQEKLQTIASHLYQAIVQVIQEGITAKEFAPHLETEVAAFTVLGAIQGSALQWSLTQSKQALRGRLTRAVSYLTQCFQSGSTSSATGLTKPPQKRSKKA